MQIAAIGRYGVTATATAAADPVGERAKLLTGLPACIRITPLGINKDSTTNQVF